MILTMNQINLDTQDEQLAGFASSPRRAEQKKPVALFSVKARRPCGPMHARGEVFDR